MTLPEQLGNLKSMGSEQKTLSIIIPVFNEEDTVQACYTAVSALAARHGDLAFEFLFADNASQDNSGAICTALAQQDPRVKYVRYSCNVGYQRSIYVGLCLAAGDAVVELDCDLEDPPEMISEFIAAWKKGFDVVYGIRKRRAEPFWKTALRKLFYRLLARVAETDIPVDAGDFRLLSRRVVDILKQVPEREPYLRGLVASLGFKQMGIPYERKPRHAGQSKFNFFGNVNLALHGLVGYSKAPMRLATYTGLLITVLSCFFALGYLVCRLTGVITQPGFTTLIIAVLISWSTTLLFLGLIGEYIATILIESRMRPRAIVETAVNIELKQNVF